MKPLAREFDLQRKMHTKARKQNSITVGCLVEPNIFNQPYGNLGACHWERQVWAGLSTYITFKRLGGPLIFLTPVWGLYT